MIINKYLRIQLQPKYSDLVRTPNTSLITAYCRHFPSSLTFKFSIDVFDTLLKDLFDGIPYPSNLDLQSSRFITK